jgi:hypothetical protein
MMATLMSVNLMAEQTAANGVAAAAFSHELVLEILQVE